MNVIANKKSQSLLRSYVGAIPDCSLDEARSAIELLMRRHGLIIRITLPNDVHEWFVDVEDPGSGLEAHDWYDYSGYERRGTEQLDQDVADDLRSFVENVSTSPLRMRIVNQKAARAVLERQVSSGAWISAVPADVIAESSGV